MSLYLAVHFMVFSSFDHSQSIFCSVNAWRKEREKKINNSRHEILICVKAVLGIYEYWARAQTKLCVFCCCCYECVFFIIIQRFEQCDDASNRVFGVFIFFSLSFALFILFIWETNPRNEYLWVRIRSISLIFKFSRSLCLSTMLLVDRFAFFISIGSGGTMYFIFFSVSFSRDAITYSLWHSSQI